MAGPPSTNSWVGSAHGYDASMGATGVRVGRRVWFVAGRIPPGPVRLRLEPKDVVLEAPRRASRGTSVRNAVPAVVIRLEPLKEGVWSVTLTAASRHLQAWVTEGARRELRLRPGRRVLALAKATGLDARPL